MDDKDINLIECKNHKRRPWYATCVHVMAGQPCAYMVAATPDEIGEALCKKCSEFDGSPPVEDLRCVCDCCFEQHVLPLSGRLN